MKHSMDKACDKPLQAMPPRRLVQMAENAHGQCWYRRRTAETAEKLN